MAKARFEDRLARLEEISERIQDQDVPIDEAGKLFEEGIKLARGLEKELAQVERRVEILSNEPEPDDPKDSPDLELFDEV